jgi:hypothetical protein
MFVEPERFDDVGFEFLEVPDLARPPRRRPRRADRIALGVLTCSAASLIAAAALAVTPAQAPLASHGGGGGGPGARSPIEFSGDRYPARGAGRHHDCHRLGVEPTTAPAPEL